MRKLLLQTILVLIIAVPAHAGNEIILAKIGDRNITMQDFERMIKVYDADKQKLLEQNPQYKAIILQRFVQATVLSDAARKEGFDKRSDIKEQIQLALNDFLATEYLKKEVVEKINVTPDDMKLYYKEHKDEFGTPEMVRARHIFFKVTKSMTDDEKEKLKEKAEAVLKRVRSGEDFAKLAEEFSDDVGSKTKGGDLGFFPKGKMIPQFEKAAFALKAGDVSDVIESPYGYHIIKVEEKKEATVEPFDKVKDKVREKVFTDFKKAKMEEFVNNAMEKAGAKVNPDAFAPKK